MITTLLVMLKTQDKRHPDIPAYQELFEQVKLISRSGDGSRQSFAFFDGMVAKTVGFFVTASKRDLKAAEKVQKRKVTSRREERMREAAAVISGMIPGSNGIAVIVHTSESMSEIAAGIQNPQAFCLPDSTDVSTIIPDDGQTVEQVARSLGGKEGLMVPHLPDGHPVPLDRVKVVVASLLGLNIDPSPSMLLCLVSTAGQLAEKGQQDSARILLSW